MTKKLSERARERRHGWVSRAFEDRARAAEEHANVVRQLLQNRAAGHIVPDHTDTGEGPMDNQEPQPATEDVE